MNKKQLRELVAKKTNNKCGYCGIDLPKRWHMDHIVPILRDSEYNYEKQAYVHNGKTRGKGTETIDNYMASCPSCNIFKSSFSLEMFRNEIFFQVKRVRERSSGFRIAEKLGLVTHHEDKHPVFYFETLGNNEVE